MRTFVDKEEFKAKLTNSLEYSSKPPGISARYFFGLSLTAVGMLTLLSVYFGLLGAAVVGVCYYATNFVHLLDGGLGYWLLYFGPIVAGSFTVVFIIKPVIARRSFPEPEEGLLAEDHPLLFALVQSLARYTQTPTPDRIVVDLQANASAAIYRVQGTKQLVLTVGLPVIATTTVQQLSGIIAHELGHLSQRGGMRLWHWSNQVADWFDHAAFGRDRWDELLDEWTNKLRHNRVGAILHLAVLFRTVAKVVAIALWFATQPIIKAMSRRMEFDADQFHVYVSGSDEFANTLLRLQLLQAAQLLAAESAEHAWHDGRLAEDLSDLCLRRLDDVLVSPELVRKCREELLREPTGWFDSHPGGRDRIARAESEALAPAITSELPATALINDFEALCREHTQRYYQDESQVTITEAETIPADELLQQQEEIDSSYDTLARFLQTYTLSSIQRIFLPFDSIPVELDANKLAVGLKIARRDYLSEIQNKKKQLESFWWAQACMKTLQQARMMTKSSLEFNADELGLPTSNRKRIEDEHQRLRILMARRQKEIAQLEKLVTSRFIAALQLSRTTSYSAKANSVLSAEKVDRIVICLAQLREVWSDVQACEIAGGHVTFLVGTAEYNSYLDSYAETLDYRATHAEELLSQLHDALSHIRFPFDHTRGGVSLADFAMGHLPEGGDIDGVARVIETATDRLKTLYVRLFAQLSLVAEEMESCLGLPPLPEAKEFAEETEVLSEARAG